MIDLTLFFNNCLFFLLTAFIFVYRMLANIAVGIVTVCMLVGMIIKMTLTLALRYLLNTPHLASAQRYFENRQRIRLAH